MLMPAIEIDDTIADARCEWGPRLLRRQQGDQTFRNGILHQIAAHADTAGYTTDVPLGLVKIGRSGAVSNFR